MWKLCEKFECLSLVWKVRMPEFGLKKWVAWLKKVCCVNPMWKAWMFEFGLKNFNAKSCFKKWVFWFKKVLLCEFNVKSSNVWFEKFECQNWLFREIFSFPETAVAYITPKFFLFSKLIFFCNLALLALNPEKTLNQTLDKHVSTKTGQQIVTLPIDNKPWLFSFYVTPNLFCLVSQLLPLAIPHHIYLLKRRY